MLRYLSLVLILVFGALMMIYFFVGVPKVYEEKTLEYTAPHFYKNSDISIENIRIIVIYFVPKNKIDSQVADWKEILDENLKKLKEFHSLQFQNRSQISYDIYPEPVIGFMDNIAYDTDVTQHGNPEALKRIANEIDSRFSSGGDLYNRIIIEEGVYQTFLIVYEGVGASGSDNVALISSVFLTKPEYEAIDSSIFAHEFYHTLGLPDDYNLVSGTPLSEDIMGLGRFRTIENTYIGKDKLVYLGL